MSRTLWLLLIFLAACNFDQGRSGVTPVTPPPQSVEALPEAAVSKPMDLADGDSIVLTAAPVKKYLLGNPVRMLAVNGSIPGPTLRVRQGARLTVTFRNRTEFPATLHPHGVRVDYKDDGASGFSQPQIEPGGEFTYHLDFPDPGAFWYHSTAREDASQPLGLYGNIEVTPKDSGYWNPVNREVTLTLGDILVDSSGATHFKPGAVDHVLMGRFGNVYLINGDTTFNLAVRRNEYVRFFVTNVAATRVFNFVLNRLYMKVVGGDNGKYERSYLSGAEMLAPGERLVCEALFADTGNFEIVHLMPDRYDHLGYIHVMPDSVTTNYGARLMATDSSAAVKADIDSFRVLFEKSPDKQLELTGRMDSMSMNMAMKSAAEQHGPGPGIEWTDAMPAMNATSTMSNTVWIMRDLETGNENHNILWRFKRGDKPMVRIYNDSDAVHAMPHPLHFHGQRFLVINVNGVRNQDLVWKDTYLVPSKATVDLLFDMSNPGDWMASCQIAEHLEDMMLMYFHVAN